MIKTDIYDENGELINGIYWGNDNDAKAFMFDAMVNYNNDFERPYECVLEDVETRNGKQVDVYGVYPLVCFGA